MEAVHRYEGTKSWATGSWATRYIGEEALRRNKPVFPLPHTRQARLPLGEDDEIARGGEGVERVVGIRHTRTLTPR
jgi:hypothetical protein